MHRKHYLVSYDISHPRRLRKVARVLEGFGYRVQFSVFQCPLDELRLERLKAKLAVEVNSDEDQVLIICLGPESEQTFNRFDWVGRPYHAAGRVTII